MLCDRACEPQDAARHTENDGTRPSELTIAALEAGPTLEELELLSLPDSMRTVLKSSETEALHCR